MTRCDRDRRRFRPLSTAAGAVAALSVALAAGCVSTPPPPLPYQALVEAATAALPLEASSQSADAAIPVDPAALNRAFLATEDFDRRLRELTLLEQQALALMDQPLRLGAVGSAILDLHYASLVGHRALAGFYKHVEHPRQARRHEEWAAAIAARIEASAEGTSDEAPLQAFSANEANAFVAMRGLERVGAKYHETEAHPFQLWIQARPAGGAVSNLFFDLSALFNALEAAVRRDPGAALPIGGAPATCRTLDMCDNFNSWAFIHLLAVRGDDSAAQTFVGWKVAGLDGGAPVGRQGDAVPWLQRAARAGNALASVTLADMHLWEANRSTEEARPIWLARAEDELERGIDLGSDGALVTLGSLYAGGVYGADKLSRGEELIQQAAALNNTAALLALARRHAYGGEDVRDAGLAERYFLRAAERDEDAKVQYARFLLFEGRAFNDRAWRWLRDMADAKNADAMVLIGYLYAKGLHVNQRLRRAKSWLKSAVKAAPDDAQVVNEVAWTLTVSPLDGLRDARYALKIMERVMRDEDNIARRVPAYLDTWAAAYAANGDFERAIALQEEAIEQASRGNTEELDVLQEHLETFRAGKLISEDVP